MQKDGIQVACAEYAQLPRSADAALRLLDGYGVPIGQQQRGTGHGFLLAIKEDFPQHGAVPTPLDAIGVFQPAGGVKGMSLQRDNLRPERFVLRRSNGMVDQIIIPISVKG